ncbi:hypothetical protein TSUD_274210 [Trifolium subterraneum]|uniref:HAT C-terminal dimerisation domain-containing protein n=1 Tax=Trifolium subterraneum TaxID=3900 RepID=A0A2Z6NKR3_TRISU|nr:hypothetical protein TSUD_274210 [Trifolium subterraneum]
MSRREAEELPVQEEEEEFPIGRAQGAPSEDIGWHFAIQGEERNTIQCYFLNPQFQFGVIHGRHVARETLDGKLLLFRDKQKSFGTPQTQEAWYGMDPSEWWLLYGYSAPELQKIAIRVLSQTTSASNCERNWSTFSYIHTKTRNRLKYQKLQKHVFEYYNMKLKNRSTMRRSQEDIEKNFSPINLDHIFQEDHLSPWLEEIEGPLLDGTQNVEWLLIDSDDDIEEIPGDDDSNSGQTPSQGGEDGLSPPSDENSGGNGGGGNQEQVHGISKGSHHSFQEEAYVRRDQNLLSHRMEEESCDDMTGGGSSTSRGRAVELNVVNVKRKLFH